MSVPQRFQPPCVPEAAVFDLDGLLVDTEPAWEDAERRLVEQLGADWDPGLRLRLLGSGLARASAILAEHVGHADPQTIERRMLVAALEEFRRGVAPRPGAAELLASLAGHVPVAVATNSRRVLADTVLASAELDAEPRVLVCAEDVDEPKPAPQPYQRACAELGVNPSATIAFEDAPPGIAAAVAAGLWTVACPSEPGASTEGAHAVVASLADVDVAALLASPA
ncbi:MAG: hypothetical protein BRC31_01750 [Actinobacteria bacterium QS_5_72_10]|jgi:HAD superfamily hydrolase (TIGR01509 family)|nr:MAG: hypothetical protein BRC32_06965 [Actinobacteria bacterium QS_8_72_14]PSO54530.1 MAG: hypothetical protein BRC31_01750 [Actinobacteria bacterium QS_5_72_10]